MLLTNNSVLLLSACGVDLTNASSATNNRGIATPFTLFVSSSSIESVMNDDITTLLLCKNR